MGSFSHNNRKCIVCSREYRYCPSCEEFRGMETWHTIYHSGNCRAVFMIACDFLDGKISAEEAKIRFDQCDLSDKENFKESIKNTIDTVYAVKSKEEDNVDEFNYEFPSFESEEVTVDNFVDNTSFNKKNKKAKKWAE